MRLDGRRESNNFDDRRGGGFGLGIGGVVGAVLIAVLTLLGGGDLGDVVRNIAGSGVTQEMASSRQNSGQESAEEQQLAKFSRQILGGTEDVWSQIFADNGLGNYSPPTMVLYTGSTTTGCGAGRSQMGPFYCSADRCLYLDLSFFMNMRRELGADGDFAYAYVIAHEVGHHVESQLGILDKAHAMMAQASEVEANRISVRIELLADFYAGVWAHHDNAMFGSLEDGDVEEAIDCAQKIGDDYLQKKAQGYDVPESFTHGTSAQRMKWLKLGLETGDITRGNALISSDAGL